MDITGLNGAGPIPPAAAAAEPVPADHRVLIQAVKAINAAEAFGQQNELTFLLDTGTHQPVIRIINRDTKELVDQIPAEYILQLAQDLA